MRVYIDTDYKCHVDPADGLTTVETDAFDGKCRAFVEGFRFVPEGHEWTREDGQKFRGEMVAPFKDYFYLAAAQAGYEESLGEVQDMTDALNLLGVNVNG